jgi:hypothetical protein
LAVVGAVREELISEREILIEIEIEKSQKTRSQVDNLGE